MLMVVLSESYIQNLEHKAIAEALTLDLAPKRIGDMFMILVRDSNLRNSLENFKRFK